MCCNTSTRGGRAPTLECVVFVVDIPLLCIPDASQKHNQMLDEFICVYDVTQAAVGVARALLSESEAIEQLHINSDRDIRKFQQIAIHQSGFSDVRPAVTPGQSGEDYMRAVPFQVSILDNVAFLK